MYKRKQKFMNMSMAGFLRGGVGRWAPPLISFCTSPEIFAPHLKSHAPALEKG
jgi:hypothetical protein